MTISSNEQDQKARYAASPKGKAALKRYRASEKGKIAIARYNKSVKGRKAFERQKKNDESVRANANNRSRHYSKDDYALILSRTLNGQLLTDSQIAKALGRTRHAISSARSYLKTVNEKRI